MKHLIIAFCAGVAIGCGDDITKQPNTQPRPDDCQPGDPPAYCVSKSQIVFCTPDGPEYVYCLECYRNEINAPVCDQGDL